MKKIAILLILFTLIIAACGSATKLEEETASSAGAVATQIAVELTEQPSTASGGESTTADSAQTITVSSAGLISVEYDADDLETSPSSSEITYIRLEGDSIGFEGSGATVNGNLITITSAGVYSLSGILNDGQIIVDTQDAETVVLVLNGASITSATSAPIYVANAGKVIINLAEGSENVISDGASYLLTDETGEPNAAIFSKDDLTINGSGSLTINANYNNGIASKDDLKITGGSITVNAVNDGIKGRDSIAIRDGAITVNAGGDGLQANNDEDPGEGFIVIEGGSLDIIAGLDGIQAETILTVSGGDLTITTGGGSVNNSTTSGSIWGGRGMEGNPNKPTESAKGLKAGVDITIAAGTINVNSADDSVHSNGSITINGGVLLLSSGDDGIHADSSLAINGGEINITQSYEGIESAILTFNDGNIHIVSSDDGINAAGGNDGSSIDGRPGQNNFDLSADYNLYVYGGYIFIDSQGDGIDINGNIEMTGGVVIVNGPTSNGNGPLDYLGTFNISGGYLVAVGSSGMAQAPSTSSTQYSLMHTYQSPQAAGSMVHIETDGGETVLAFAPTKEYQSVLVLTPELSNGSTYVLYSGGSSTGRATDGLYSGGVYTAGAQVASYTITSIVTGAGSWRGDFPGGPGGNMRPQRP